MNVKAQISPPRAPAMPRPDADAVINKVYVDKPIDFRSVLLESNRTIKDRLQAEDNGDLSKAESYESFLESLNRQTQKERIPKKELGKDDFLKLFITQLQNQDPLKPKDGTEMASELAQFNGLEQMMNVNDTLVRLENVTEKSQNMGLIGLIGKEVDLPEGRVKVDGGLQNKVMIDVKQPLSQVKLTVKDEKGESVASRDLGTLKSGVGELSWDGKNEQGESVVSGTYHVEVSGMDSQGMEVQAALTSTLDVTGIDLEEGQLKTAVGKLSVGEVSGIYDKGAERHQSRIEKEAGVEPAASKPKLSDAAPIRALPASKSVSEGASNLPPGLAEALKAAKQSVAQAKSKNPPVDELVGRHDTDIAPNTAPSQSRPSIYRPESQSPFSGFAAATITK